MGSYPAEAPTDPDLPDSGIRLLGLWIHCASVNAMDDTWRGQSVVFRQTVRSSPVQPSVPRAAFQPLVPRPPGFVMKPTQGAGVLGDAVVGVGALDLAEMRPRSSTLLNPCINLLESSCNAPMPKHVGPQQRIDDRRKTSPPIGIMDKVPDHIPTTSAPWHRSP